MNKDRRAELQRALDLIAGAQQIVEDIKGQESDSYDNLSENLQQSERGQNMNENVDALDNAFSSLDEAIDYINTAAE